jgi:hypothetical protein
MGMFKSSGILISTGTGSKGWMLSARKVSPYDVKALQNIIGNEESTDEVRINKDFRISLIY